MKHWALLQNALFSFFFAKVFQCLWLVWKCCPLNVQHANQAETHVHRSFYKISGRHTAQPTNRRALVRSPKRKAYIQFFVCVEENPYFQLVVEIDVNAPKELRFLYIIRLVGRAKSESIATIFLRQCRFRRFCTTSNSSSQLHTAR